MKNIKTKIILSAIIFLSVAGFIGTANATTASLYVSPASLTKITGNIFSVSMGFNASGNKVCAVEGTIVFNNLTCQSITVASDVMAQSLPTCSNLHFLVGIPNCTTADKALLILSVKAGSAGVASIGFTGVDIIGEGVSVGSASISGNYTINAVPTPTPTPTPKSASAQQITQPTQQTTTTVTPIEEEEKVIAAQPEEQKIGESPSLLASIGSIVTFGTGNVWVALTVIIILAIVVYVIYTFIQKKRKKFGKMQ